MNSFKEIRFTAWVVLQSQFWARSEVGVECPRQEMAVQPSEKAPKAISVRTLRARMDRKGRVEPAAMPSTGRGIAVSYFVVERSIGIKTGEIYMI